LSKGRKRWAITEIVMESLLFKFWFWFSWKEKNLLPSPVLFIGRQ
jgi:hypothetical protein